MPNGAVGDYLRIASYEWNKNVRRAYAQLWVYTDATYAAAHPEFPLGCIAQVALEDDKFDDYLSRSALEALPTPGPDPVLDQLYAAMKTEELRLSPGIAALDLSAAVDV